MPNIYGIKNWNKIERLVNSLTNSAVNNSSGKLIMVVFQHPAPENSYCRKAIQRLHLKEEGPGHGVHSQGLHQQGNLCMMVSWEQDSGRQHEIARIHSTTCQTWLAGPLVALMLIDAFLLGEKLKIFKIKKMSNETSSTPKSHWVHKSARPTFRNMKQSLMLRLPKTSDIN